MLSAGSRFSLILPASRSTEGTSPGIAGLHLDLGADALFESRYV